DPYSAAESRGARGVGADQIALDDVLVAEERDAEIAAHDDVAGDGVAAGAGLALLDGIDGRKGRGAGGVEADVIALHERAAGAVPPQGDGPASAAHDHVAVLCRRAANGIAGAAVHLNDGTPAAEERGPGHIRA